MIQTGDGVIRADDEMNKKKGVLMLPHPLTNLEIQKYFQNEPKFKAVYSRHNQPNI